jgi:hypothetical protein
MIIKVGTRLPRLGLNASPPHLVEQELDEAAHAVYDSADLEDGGQRIATVLSG